MEKQTDNENNGDIGRLYYGDGIDYSTDFLTVKSKKYKIRRTYIYCGEEKLEEVTVYFDYITGSDFIDVMAMMEDLGFDLGYIQNNKMYFRQIPVVLFVNGKFSGTLHEYYKVKR